MQQFLDKHPKFKNPMFYIGLIAVIFAGAGIDVDTLTSWQLLGQALLSIVENPFTLICVIVAILGVFNDNGTEGIDGLDKIFKIKK